MIDLYDFIEDCKEQGLDAHEAMQEFYRAQEALKTAFYEDYYSRPEVCAGWAQNDVIDAYRRER